MVQCLMSIFHLITILEDIVVLHTYNILETKVADLMLTPQCFCVEILFCVIDLFRISNCLH